MPEVDVQTVLNAIRGVYQGPNRVTDNATQQRLNAIDQKLDEISDKLESLEAKVDQKKEYSGYSNETKPTGPDIEKGSKYFEIDTGNRYIYDSAEWVLMY